MNSGLLGALIALGATSACTQSETASRSPTTAGSDNGSALLAVAGTEYTIAWSPDMGARPVDVSIVDTSGIATPLLPGIGDTGSAVVQFPLLEPSVDAIDLEVRDASSGTHRLDASVRPAALAEFVWNQAGGVEEYRWLDPATCSGPSELRGVTGPPPRSAGRRSSPG